MLRRGFGRISQEKWRFFRHEKRWGEGFLYDHGYAIDMDGGWVGGIPYTIDGWSFTKSG